MTFDDNGNLIITISNTEKNIATYIGTARRRANEKAGTVDQRQAIDKSSLDIDITGFIGELAFAKAFGVYPDFSISPRRGTPDFTISGKTVDVKVAPKRDKLNLLVNKSFKTDYCDVFVLGMVDDRTITFFGYAYREKVILDSNLRVMVRGGKPTYFFDRNMMNKFSKDMTFV